MSFFDIAGDEGEGDWGLGVGGDSGESTRFGGAGINITVTIKQASLALVCTSYTGEIR